MESSGSRSRERVPTIAELRQNGFSNVKQTEINGKTYLIAVKDSVQVDLDSFIRTADLRAWVIENMSSVRVFQTNAQGRSTRELNRRDISELPIPEEAAETAAAVPVPVPEHIRLGKETDARTRQIVRAFESRTYEGITFPGTGGARAEFFQQFSDPERQILQRAWDFAGTKERELFAAELNAFFSETGDGRMGMMTLAKILQRMASDYLSHQGAYAQARFFTITDFYHYTSDIMEDEKTVGGAREHSIGSIGREMKGAVHRRYVSLIDELKEERRTAIIRRLPGLEQVPTPAEGAQAEAAQGAAHAAPAETVTEAAPTQIPGALERMYMYYSQIEFDQAMISRLPAGSPQLANLQASMRAHEDQFLAFVQSQPQEIQDAAKWRVRAIEDRKAAELSAPATATQTEAAGGAAAPATEEAMAAAVEEAPAEEPATAAVESASAEAAQAAQVEVYDYARFQQIADRLDQLVPEGYMFSDPRILDTGLFPDTAEEVHVLYNGIQAHFADMEAILAAGNLTANQINLLALLRASVEKALGIVP
jgi:hypothetical protein